MAGVFYGWRIVGVALLTHCVTVGLVFYSFGVFLPLLSKQFDWSRGQVSFCISLVSLCGAVYAPFVGYELKFLDLLILREMLIFLIYNIIE